MAFMRVAECIEQLVTIAEQQAKPDIEHVNLMAATGRILAEDIIATIDVPPADNSAMDGYALNTQHIELDQAIKVSQRIQAGDTPRPLAQGTAARIFTGAEIPMGANCVVMQENCQAELDAIESWVTLLQTGHAGDNIRRRGQDIAAGTTILSQGLRLRPQDIGLLASIGIAEVPVYRELTIGIVNTGSELVEPGTQLESGQIYNSNRFLVDSICRQWGFKTRHVKIVSDSYEETRRTFAELAKQVDVIISTGGVSVGEEDHVKPAIKALGELNLWKVAIKPGKPFAFGHIDHHNHNNNKLDNSDPNQQPKTHFIGLPGNPASTFVTLLILARPYLLTRQGRSMADRQVHYQLANANFNKAAVQRQEYIRARSNKPTTQKNQVEIYQNQSSGVLFSASWGDCFVLQETDNAIKLSDSVPTLLYNDLLH